MLGPDPNRELVKDSTRLAAFLQECLALGSLRVLLYFENFPRHDTGYAKYRCPYVWLRSHHNQLIRAQPGHIDDDDNPLQLQKTNEWKIKDISLWEMVAEIVQMTSSPKNPFQIDFDYIDKLPLEESVLLTGSLLAFLQNVWIEADPCIVFADDLYTEIQVLQSKHLDNVQMNGRVLDVKEGSTEDAAEVIVYTQKNDDCLNQLWRYENGYFINVKSAKVLDICGGEMSPESPIIQYAQKMSEEAANQKWGIDGDGYIFCSARPDLVLDIKSREDDDGAAVILYEKRDGEVASNQRWTLEEYSG
ncbi:hypothetical protein [Parasitella parasitica]|uniref:Uncharacterized protein n=1 Tax=Parasitella parasitica TaxID=35722 RepID=A0A0B7N6T5_9FUNG|nr:hypothetical protein [Parasitella parasitica]